MCEILIIQRRRYSLDSSQLSEYATTMILLDSLQGSHPLLGNIRGSFPAGHVLVQLEQFLRCPH